MSPKTLSARASNTRQLLAQSSPQIEDLLRDDITKQIGLAIDWAALHGTGSGGQPTGLELVSGPTSVDHGGSGGPPTWAKAVEFETGVAHANAGIDARLA